MIKATLEEKRAAMGRKRISKGSKGNVAEEVYRQWMEADMKTVMKGSAGKMVEREELPPVPPPPPEPPKKVSASMLLIRKAKELADQGKSQTLIACEMGKDETWVRGSLLIATKLPASAHQAIADNKFSRTAALQLLLANPDKIESIVEGALKIAEVEGKL